MLMIGISSKLEFYKVLIICKFLFGLDTAVEL